MKIFLTGASGQVGSALLDAFIRAGHDVTGLVRSAAKGARIAGRGARPLVGNVADPATFEQGAGGHDAYVHATFDGSPRGPEIDRLAIRTLIQIARASHAKCLIYTSGVWVVGPTSTPAAEDTPLNPPAISAWRPAHEQMVLEASGDSLRTIVVRPGILYGGARGIVGDMFRDAANGLMRVVGTGENHWPLIYDRDVADLYARLVISPDASGIYHANDEGDERVIDIVEAISRHTGRAELRHMPLPEARAKMGPYADALVLDQIIRSVRARAIGWAPTLHSVAGNVARLLGEWRAGQQD